MKNLKDEIEGILGRNGIYNYRKTYVYSSAEDARADRAMDTEVEQLPVIKELTSLIEQENEQFLIKFKDYVFKQPMNVKLWHEYIEQYLAERKG